MCGPAHILNRLGKEPRVGHVELTVECTQMCFFWSKKKSKYSKIRRLKHDIWIRVSHTATGTIIKSKEKVTTELLITHKNENLMMLRNAGVVSSGLSIVPSVPGSLIRLELQQGVSLGIQPRRLLA